jgi:hypothetical protein
MKIKIIFYFTNLITVHKKPNIYITTYIGRISLSLYIANVNFFFFFLIYSNAKFNHFILIYDLGVEVKSKKRNTCNNNNHII